MQVFFEEIPPVAEAAAEQAAHLDRLERILSECRLDAIVLPEILEEVRGDKPVISAKPRVDSLAYAGELRRRFGVRVIPYRVVCRATRSRQDNLDWFVRCRDLGFTDLVLVGAQSPHVAYPCGILEMNELAARELGLRVGNILIPSRPDELGRVRAKMRSGTRFFTTQVLFEPEETLALLRGLRATPAPEPPAIYLCFSPLSRPEHLDFARDIGCTLTPAFLERAQAAAEKHGRLEKVCVKAIRATWHAIEAFLAAQAPPCEVGLLIGDLGRKSNHAAADGLLREFAARKPAP